MPSKPFTSFLKYLFLNEWGQAIVISFCRERLFSFYIMGAFLGKATGNFLASLLVIISLAQAYQLPPL